MAKIISQLLRLVIFSLFFWWLIYPFSSQALISPQVYLADLSLSKSSFEPGEVIQGTVSLWNYEQFVVSDLIFHFQLLGKEVDGVPTELIDEQIAKEVFSLSAEEKATKSFTYNLPANLPVGDFKLRIRLTNTRGEEMGWIDKVISIGGEGKFLTLDNYWIVKDGKDLSPGGGVYYQPGEIPEIRFDAKNNSSFTISAFPKITTYKRNVGGEILSQEQKESLTLKPGETKTQRTFLPQLTNPDSYLSEVRLYSNEDQKLISNSIYFRWIISGQDDAEILFVQSDKDTYTAGEVAKIKIQFTGPATHELEGGQQIIEVKLIDEKGKVAGEGEKTVEAKVGEIEISVPIKKNVDNPKISVQIVKGGKVVDQYEFQAKSLIEKREEKKEEPVKISFWEKNKKIIIPILFFIIILIGGIIIYYLKQKKQGLIKSLIFFLLLGSGISFFANNVSAATKVTNSPCPTMIIFNSPPPNQTYKPGDIVNFSGAFRVVSCGDGLFFNKIEFFIAEDKEISIKNRNCCGDCCGAQSTSYGCSAFSWCDIVQILDSTQPGYKIRKLGTIYPADVHSGATPYWVEYNQYLTIPSDLGFSGPVRFYVQYSGTHWNSHWHWNITYQPGYLNHILTVPKAGTGSGTVTSAPSGINCGATCSASYNHGTSVTLTASASTGSSFGGWSGEGCSGTGTCTVTMTQAKNVTATFNLILPDFSLNSSNGLYATLTLNQKGDSNSATLTITPFNGFTSNVALSVASVSPALPGGTTYQFSPSALNQSKYSSGSQFKVKIGAGISSSKVYTITVQAADGGLVRTVNILLNAQIKNPNWKEF